MEQLARCGRRDPVVQAKRHHRGILRLRSPRRPPLRMTKPILQIVPRLSGANNGVGDYARTVAQRLAERCNLQTMFADADSALDRRDFAHVILHYVNYGYQKRGVPFALLPVLRKIRARCPGKFLTIFHELYASGRALWESAFWLRPLQIQIAKSIAQISDVAIVSSETMLRQLHQFAPETNASVHPVFSSFGEPSLSADQLVNRSPNRWVVCGGTAVVERSLRSISAVANRIPERFIIRELLVVGGNDNETVRTLIGELPGIRAEYRPRIAAADASQILSSCGFGWLDYFHRPSVPTEVVLKSSSFAALCAHGVIPVFPDRGSDISIAGDALPGPFFVDQNANNFPATDARPAVAGELYQWYRRRAASEHVAAKIAAALGLTALS